MDNIELVSMKEQEDVCNEEIDTAEGKKWTALEVRQLITLFKESELLWNIKSKDYRDRMKKQETIRHIAEILQVEPSEVTRKLHNLRTQFNTEVRKLKKKASNQETDGIYTSKWPFFSSLLFLAHLQMVDNSVQESDGEPINDIYDSEVSRPNEVSGFDEEVAYEVITRSLPATSTASKRRSRTPSKKRKCKVSSDKSPNVLIHQPSDGAETFGAFVASELRQIKNPANKRKLKKIIMEAISNIAEADALEHVYEETP